MVGRGQTQLAHPLDVYRSLPRATVVGGMEVAGQVAALGPKGVSSALVLSDVSYALRHGPLGRGALKGAAQLGCPLQPLRLLVAAYAWGHVLGRDA